MRLVSGAKQLAHGNLKMLYKLCQAPHILAEI